LLADAACARGSAIRATVWSYVAYLLGEDEDGPHELSAIK
jgi:hypothetical protein